MKEKQKIVTGYRSRYRNADRKEKTAVLDEVQFITGYNRKGKKSVPMRLSHPSAAR
jgi:hypothetical protein